MRRSIAWVAFCVTTSRGFSSSSTSVPQLKYVVGGSLLIARFDNELADAAANSARLPDTAKIFAGGGRGTFTCETQDDANRLGSELVRRAHQLGLDLRIGIDESLSEASHHADDLYPFVPESLEGEPCRVSGLWPITLESSRGFTEEGRGIHPLIWKRREAAIQRDGAKTTADTLSQQIVGELRQRDLLPHDLRGRELVLLRVVGGERQEDPALISEADAAHVALGRRNRCGNSRHGWKMTWEVNSSPWKKSGPSEEVFEPMAATHERRGQALYAQCVRGGPRPALSQCGGIS